MAKADKEDKFIMTILIIGVVIFIIILLLAFIGGYTIARNKAKASQMKASQSSQQFKDLQQMYH
ncbi:MAG TPA: hypothetical protein VG917_03690 [Patescibacteria group bacterium]|nr:hypothetical protein [Patescibacteria group bacterium]